MTEFPVVDEEVLLLWALMSGALLALACAALLAVGALYGLAWLVWRLLLALAWLVEHLVFRGPREEKGSDVVDTVEFGHAPVSWRVRASGGQSSVRVQAGLVPASACLARRRHVSVDRRRRRRARPGDG